MTTTLRASRQSPVEFAQEAWAELRKVTWPSRETVLRLTLIVLVISTLIAAYIFAFDNLFTLVITKGIVGSPTETPIPALTLPSSISRQHRSGAAPTAFPAPDCASPAKKALVTGGTASRKPAAIPVRSSKSTAV